jgi:hypothetical protein
MKPGLYDEIPDDAYHADPAVTRSLSSTFARLLTEHVPAKAEAIRSTHRPTKAMTLGTAVHKIVLGAGPDLIVWQHDGRTKAGKDERDEHREAIASQAAVAVTAEQLNTITAMADALRKHPLVEHVLDNSSKEVTAVWQEGETWMRARYDILTDTAGFDYKTTDDASRRGFQKAMADYGYHQQAEFYQRGLSALGHAGGARPIKFICQEKSPPYLVQVHTPDRDALDTARQLNDRAIRIFAAAIKDGAWPGFETLSAEPTGLPAYYFYRHEEIFGPVFEEIEVN